MYIVFFLLKAAIFVGLMRLNVVVVARLLLNKQLEIGGHQVGTALQSQLLADERRLKDCLFPIESDVGLRLHQITMKVAKEFSNNLLDVLGLSKCGRSEVFLTVKVIASAVFQGFILEVLFKGFLPDIMPVTIDNVVQSSTGKVSKQDGLAVGCRRHGIDEVGKWVVSVVSKASGNAADINEIVGLIYDYRGFFGCIYIDKIYL